MLKKLNQRIYLKWVAIRPVLVPSRKDRIYVLVNKKKISMMQSYFYISYIEV